MEKKIIFTAEMHGSDAVLKEIATLRDENAKLTNEQKVRQAAEKNGIKISEQERIEYEKRAVQLKENKRQINELTKAYQGHEQRVEGLRPKLTQLRKRMQELALEGKRGTQEFKNLRKEASALQDTVDKAQAEIKYFADDLRNLKTGVDAISAVSAGFQAVTGVMAIAGVENEEFEKTLLKVQGAMAVTNSLQQLSNALRKEGSIRLGAMVLMTKLQAVAATIATGATWAWTVSVKAFTKAIYKVPIIGWLLKIIALVGLLVAAIYNLIKHWRDVVAWIKKAFDWLVFWKDLSEKTDESTKKLVRTMESYVEVLERKNKALKESIDKLGFELKLLKAKGASEDELIAKERELLAVNVELMKNEFRRIMASKEATEEDKKKAKDNLKNAMRELALFDLEQKTKTQVAKQEAIKRKQEAIKQKREEQLRIIEEERVAMEELNRQYQEQALAQEEERAAQRVAAYEKRKEERRLQREEEQREIDEARTAYEMHLEQERQSEMTDYELRMEQYKSWLNSKAITQAQYNKLVDKLNAKELEAYKRIQGERAIASLQASQQLVENIGEVLGAQTEAAKFIKVLSIAEAIANMQVAAAATAKIGFPQNLPMLIGLAAQAASIVGKLKSIVIPEPNVKLAKGGIIGGKSHSAGGTVFRGTDGSVFEAEKGEYLAVVNKYDASRAALLDSINSKHGLPFGISRGYYAKGGIQMPQPRNDFRQDNFDDAIREAVDRIASIPVIVSERDISTTQRRVAVYEGKGNL